MYAPFRSNYLNFTTMPHIPPLNFTILYFYIVKYKKSLNPFGSSDFCVSNYSNIGAFN
ncbi:hypothetical protein LALCM10_140044 [Dellaglioa algida]|nr:hypothetical protein LALCM10_140044 [Dellaglioa algida]